MVNKYQAEFGFWQSRFKLDNGIFKNAHYQRLMLGMANEPNDDFLKGKIVADFGCGPRGSLVWAKSAAVRIGIDVLADAYADVFTKNILSHNMIYLKSTEKVIPIPDNFVDVMFSLNAIDHVSDFPKICEEILRVLKPNGDFIGSFNLEEPPTACEPLTLNEDICNRYLIQHLEIKSYRVTNRLSENNAYEPFFSNKPLHYDKGKIGFLWVRGTKK